ncbi:MAG: autotransporter-associated beta strand repeat-containing protein, partial [Rubrivivax sp.]|nr:autotransporter-associated beta strand repeat-containing protein [Rubrivivax sp.]
SGGTLAIAADAQLGTAPGAATAGHLRLEGGTLAVSNSFTLHALRGVAIDSGNSTIEVASTRTLQIAGSVADGVVAGTLAKTGAGTLLLQNPSSNTGAVTVSAGTLVLDGAGASAGSGALTVGAAGALDIRNGGALANSLTLDGGALQTSAGTGSITGTVALNADSSLNAGGGATLTVSNAISGARALDKTGSGAVVLSGVNSFAGPLTVSAGSLTLQGGSAVANTAAVSVATGATLVLASAETIGRLSGTGNATLNATLTAGDGNSTSFSGVLSGSGGLVKQGAGAFTLGGVNTFSGATTVNAGTLVVDGTLASAVIDVNAGALTLGAADRLANNAALQVASGATATLGGADTIGSLSLSGTLAGGFTLTATSYALAGGTANASLGTGTLSSTGASQLNAAAAAGTVNVNGGTLTLGAANLLADPA